MTYDEKDQFLNAISKLHDTALKADLSNDVLMALCGLYTIAKYEFEKPYPLPVAVYFPGDENPHFRLSAPSNNQPIKEIK